MAETSTLLSLPELLNLAGLRVRSARRADCVCPGQSQKTIAFDGTVFYCHRCGRKGNRESLLRELGLLPNDPQSIARRRREAREAARLRSVAERLRTAERRVLFAARANLLSLVAIRRNAGARLARFPGEAEFAWDALRFVAEHQARTSASYFVAAFASEQDRAVFSLHPEQRAAMVDRVLENGGLRADGGRWVEFFI